MANTFKAIVHTGIINDKKKGPTKGTWIYARDIPKDLLEKEWKGPHPHTIDGMAWCLKTERDGDVYQWRRLANAESEKGEESTVNADQNHPHWFYC